ncbi:MAG: hypothetical protein ACRDUB_05345 [Mycobacterium sp.]
MVSSYFAGAALVMASTLDGVVHVAVAPMLAGATTGEEYVVFAGASPEPANVLAGFAPCAALNAPSVTIAPAPITPKIARRERHDV